MSDSVISNIYREISKMKIGTIPARNIDKIKLEIKDSDLPMRMLLPSAEGDLGFVGIGSLNNIQWTIRDLCLWAPVSAGKGIEQYAGSMVDYLKLYIAAVKASRNPTGQSTISNVAFTMGPVPWGEQDYWAVNIILTVEEIL